MICCSHGYRMPLRVITSYGHDVIITASGLEVTMTGNKRTVEKDRLKDRSDIGEVEFPIEKLMKFRDASASCVHIEAALEANRGLTETGKKRPR